MHDHTTAPSLLATLLRAASAAVAVASPFATLAAQCQLEVMQPPLAGANGQVAASVRWDPDGAGPLGPQLVFGGFFSNIGSTPVSSIGAFDPATSTWSDLGGGVSLPAFPGGQFVTALASTPIGDLFAAGRFTLAGGALAQNIARWNGMSWAALGSGLTHSSTPGSTAVNAMTALPNGDLVVGGYFNVAGGVAVNGIALWNGTAWQSMAGGLTLAPGVAGTPFGFTVAPNGDLVVVGNFFFAGGVATNRIARWNGSWSAIPSAAGTCTRVAALANGDLVAWWFDAFSSPPTSDLKLWNGTTWNSIGAVGPVGTAGIGGMVVADNGDLLVTGSFQSIAGVAAPQVARWNGTAWSAIGSGMTNAPGQLAEGSTLQQAPDGTLWVGGSFQAIGTNAGPNLAWWDGIAWSSDPLAVAGFGSPTVLRVVADGANGLLVGGSFTSVGHTPANNIASWDGTRWTPLGSGVTSSLWPFPVMAIARTATGRIVVGGAFETAGGVPAANIAQWDGSAWSAMGNLGGLVNDLVVLQNGDLIAGGNFNGTPGTPLWNVARWTGSAWAPIGSNTTNPVLAMTAMPDGSLVAAFDTYGPLRWNGSFWGNLGAQWPFGSSIRSFAVQPDGALVAAGTFTAAGGVSALNVARWNGTAWSAMGTGIASTVRRVQALPDGSVLAFPQNYTQNGSVLRWNGQAWQSQTAASTWLNGVVSDAALRPNGDVALAGGFSPNGSTTPRRLATLRSTCPASAVGVPSACVRPGGPLTTTTPVLPWTGGTMTTTAQPLTATSIGLVATGFAATQVPLSLLDPSAGVNCDLLTTPDVIQVAAIGNGVGTTLLAIPARTLLVGAVLRQQAVELVVGPSSLTGVYTSNALTLTIGAYN